MIANGPSFGSRQADRTQLCALATVRRRSPPVAALIVCSTLWSSLHPVVAYATEAPAGEQVPAAEGDYDDATSLALQSQLTSQLTVDAAPAPARTDTQEPSGGDVRAGSSPSSAGGAVSRQALSMPSGAASAFGMGDSFSAQLSTGVAAFNIPFQSPAARGAAQISLSLVYASSGGLGLAGYGWNLGGPLYIARQLDRGVPTYDDRADWHPNQDRFIFGAQELVPICTVNATECVGALPDEVMPVWADGWQYFRARVEGAFLRFFWSPDHLTWRIQAKAGLQFELGQPLDGSGYQEALERNPDAPSEIYRWHLVRKYDAQGAPDAQPPAPVNQVVYRYIQDGGIAYLTDVFDTPPAADPQDPDLGKYAHHISLRYEFRPDATTTYRNGWKLEQRVRLVGVDIASKPFAGLITASRELTRRYHLTYDPDTHVSLLTSVQLEGRCDEPIQEDENQLLPVTACPRLPSTTLEYQRVDSTSETLADSNGLAFEPIATEVGYVDSSPEHSLDDGQVGLLDLNSDGLPDVLVTRPELHDGQHAVLFNQGVRGGKLRFSRARGVPVTPAGSVDAAVLQLASSNVNVLDLDGDASADLLHMPQAKRYTVFSARKTVESESGWSFQGRSIETADEQDFRINFAQDARRTAVMDVNGDGLVDVVFASATEYQTFFALGRYPGGDGQFGRAEWTGPDTASLSNEPVTSCTPWSSEPARLGDQDVLIADLNGDQLPDIARVRSGQMLYWPGRGNGTWATGDRQDCPAGSFGQERHIVMQNAPDFDTVHAGRLLLADVNADGLADLVEVRADAVDIYLNDNGLGFTDRQVLSNVPFTANGTNAVRLVDINGSGSSDILWGFGHDYRYLDLTGGVRPYLLTTVHNGLGRTTELEYASSTQLMVKADEQGIPWSSVSPLTMPAIVRVRLRDNLESIGLPRGEYVTEYVYRDPHFEGRQREFRGFRSADAILVGDANSPTATTRSVHLLGECEVAQSGFDVCAMAKRWQDNWREPLKGLVAYTETFDDNGIYLESSIPEYELRQLYTGRDGRRVSVAYNVGTTSLRYDTAGFDASPSSLEFALLGVDLEGIEQSESQTVVQRADAGTVRIRQTAVFDDYGNQLESTSAGCAAGCSNTDESITSVVEHGLVDGDASGWLWRSHHNYIVGSVHTGRRNEQHREFDARGNLLRSMATLSGTLPLDRFHESDDDVAPAPAEASGGAAAPIDFETVRYERDDFGNVIDLFAPSGRCRSASFDPQYAQLPVSETSFGGPDDGGANGCGSRAFTTTVIYDRGFGLVNSSVSVTGQPAAFDYDGFGRLRAATYVDPDNPGVLAAAPAATHEYFVTEDPSGTPYSITLTRRRDGANHNTSDYHESYTYVDGLGRVLLTVSEADPSVGDQGQYVVGRRTKYDAKGALQRNYLNSFWNGDPLAVPIQELPNTRYASMRYDAFGRQQAVSGHDGRRKFQAAYHALSTDQWDAADIEIGPHQGSYATVETDGHGRQVRATERLHDNGELEERHVLTEYLPTGEPLRITQRRAGSADTVRWFRYDSLGRLVLNAEPNTSTGFTPDYNQDPNTIKAWRYAYNDLGQLVGVSDARGCGVNIFFDRAGRPVAEDYSPCQDHHPAYTAPDLATGDGTESFYRYDLPDPDGAAPGGVADAAGNILTVDDTLLWGRSVSLADRGSKGIVAYDALGRITGGAIKVVKPGPPAAELTQRYAPRWYIRQTAFDGANRVVQVSSGATSPDLMGSDGKSVAQFQYSRRGIAQRVLSSYGVLLDARVVDENGLEQKLTFGDGASTERAFAYDDQLRLKSAQTYRAAAPLWSDAAIGTPAAGEPTQQLLLEDSEFEYDEVSNISRMTDWRIPQEWPESAAPVTRTFEYDDLYRMVNSTHRYPTGTDPWTSPFDAENTDQSDAVQPGPHVDFVDRVLEQRYGYDHLGNISVSDDDAEGFFDRSLGTVAHGGATTGPHQAITASNRTTGSERQGDLEAAYDPAGHLTDLIVRRDGPCLPVGASCWQRFHYEWDAVGQLSRARRWDLAASNPNERSAHGTLSTPLPTRIPDAELRYSYDGIGRRVLKTAVDASTVEQHTVYIFDGLELRSTSFSGSGTGADYALSAQTETVYLSAGGARARVLYAEQDLPTLTSGSQHVFLIFADHLGSGSFIIDHETGELVEYSTYQAYGQTDSDYRPGRWGQFREPRKFSGKEEDVEVGLAYFGARYLSVGLNRWMSADPVTIHELGSDANPYAYVKGRPLVAVDPDGREIITAIVIGIAVGAVIAAGTNTAMQYHQTGSLRQTDLGWNGVLGAAVVGGIAGGLSGGVGAAVGGLFSSAVIGATVGGAAGGAAGAAGGYAATWAIATGRGHDNSWSVSGGTPFSLRGLGTSMLIGAGVGAASGFIAHQISGPSSNAPTDDTTVGDTKVADAPDIEFDSAEEAAEWASSRYYDAGQAQKVEYGGYITKNENGKYVLGDIYVGKSGGTVKPETFGREVNAGEEIHGWHTHPNDAQFSEGHFSPGGDDPNSGYVSDEGDLAGVEQRAKLHEYAATRTYMASPSRQLSSIGQSGPMPWGTPHGTLWIPRAAPAAGGMIGGAIATPVARAWFGEATH